MEATSSGSSLSSVGSDDVVVVKEDVKASTMAPTIAPMQQPTPPDSTGDRADHSPHPAPAASPAAHQPPNGTNAPVEGKEQAMEVEDDSGPDYYTSASDSDTDRDDDYIESRMSPKAREKRQRLRKERDLLKPKYYYGEKEATEEAERKGGRVRSKGSKKGNRGVPVFEPTMEQFRDFYSYVQAIDHWGMRSGIVKIIPPKEWTESLPHLGRETLREDGKGQMLKEARIKSPIEQHVQGSSGLYRVMNVAKSKIYNPLQWYDFVNSRGLAPPNFFHKSDPTEPTDTTEDPSEAGPRATRSARAGAIRQLEKKKPSTRGTWSRKKKPEQLESANASEAGTPAPPEVPGTPTPARVETEVKTEEVAQEDQAAGESAVASHGEGAAASTATLRKVHVDLVPVQESYAEGTPASLPGTPAAAAAAMATTETGAQTPATIVVEGPASESKPSTSRKRKPPHLTNIPEDDEWAEFVKVYDQLPYGATREDYSVEACKEIEAQYWRSVAVGKEPVYGADTKGSLFDERTTEWNVAHLDNLLTRLKLKQKIPGVNTPYLYFGAWRATFAWHVEDADLYSINYIHFGAPKYWYAIAQCDNPRFERFMASQFGPEAKKCSQFLRHKAFLASPQHLANAGISLNRVAQMPGEIILTYPYGYHSGFNLGFNCAESVNFATESWIEIGRKAKACACIDDSVSINVDAWLAEHEAAIAKEQERLAKREAKRSGSTKRKRDSEAPVGAEGAATAKRKVAGDGAPGSFIAVVVPKKKEPVKKEYPCALCPDPSEETLVRVLEDTPGKKPKRAHKICAMFTPSTWIEALPDGEEVVMGFADVEKARWALKCQLCNEKMGTKVQCTKSVKCVRACHVTCGLRADSGFVVDAHLGTPPHTHSVLDPNAGPIPPHIDPNGPVNLVILCRQHNPEWVKIEAARKAQALSDRITAIPLQSHVKIRISGGVFAVFLLAHHPERKTISAQFENGQCGEIAHSKIVFEKPEKAGRKDDDDPYIYEHARNTGTRTRDAGASATPTPCPAPLPPAQPPAAPAPMTVPAPTQVSAQSPPANAPPYPAIGYPRPAYPTQMAPYPSVLMPAPHAAIPQPYFTMASMPPYPQSALPQMGTYPVEATFALTSPPGPLGNFPPA